MTRILLAAALAFVTATAAYASDDIWTALVLATNETPPADIPKPLANFLPTIKQVFGYNSLYLLGQKKRTLDTATDEWLVPSKDFFFKVVCLERDPAHYRFRIELFRDSDLLLTTEVRLARDGPLFIRGPQWGKGQLVLLIEVR